jgi:hypothetical protein
LFLWLCCYDALVEQNMLEYQRLGKLLVRRDRDMHHQCLIEDAARADEVGDRHAVWKIVKYLSGTASKAIDSVKVADGNTIFDPRAVDMRLQQHFAEVLKAKVIPDVSIADPCPRDAPRDASACMPSLKSGKAAGPDGIQPVVHKAGGKVVTTLLHGLMMRISTECR